MKHEVQRCKSGNTDRPIKPRQDLGGKMSQLARFPVLGSQQERSLNPRAGIASETAALSSGLGLLEVRGHGWP